MNRRTLLKSVAIASVTASTSALGLVRELGSSKTSRGKRSDLVAISKLNVVFDGPFDFSFSSTGSQVQVLCADISGHVYAVGGTKVQKGTHYTLIGASGPNAVSAINVDPKVNDFRNPTSLTPDPNKSPYFTVDLEYPNAVLVAQSYNVEVQFQSGQTKETIMPSLIVLTYNVPNIADLNVRNSNWQPTASSVDPSFTNLVITAGLPAASPDPDPFAKHAKGAFGETVRLFQGLDNMALLNVGCEHQSYKVPGLDPGRGMDVNCKSGGLIIGL